MGETRSQTIPNGGFICFKWAFLLYVLRKSKLVGCLWQSEGILSVVWLLPNFLLKIGTLECDENEETISYAIFLRCSLGTRSSWCAWAPNWPWVGVEGSNGGGVIFNRSINCPSYPLFRSSLSKEPFWPLALRSQHLNSPYPACTHAIKHTVA